MISGGGMRPICDKAVFWGDRAISADWGNFEGASNDGSGMEDDNEIESNYIDVGVKTSEKEDGGQ